jgi:hypothetical protein
MSLATAASRSMGRPVSNFQAVVGQETRRVGHGRQVRHAEGDRLVGGQRLPERLPGGHELERRLQAPLGQPGRPPVDRFGVDPQRDLERRLRLLGPRHGQHPAVGAGLDAQHGGGEGQGAVVAHLDLVLQEAARRTGQLHGGDGPAVELVGGGEADTVDVGPPEAGVGERRRTGLEDELGEVHRLG